MNIAIPFFRNRISNRLDCSENFLIVTIEDGDIKKRRNIRLVHNKPSALACILKEFEIDILICNGITDFYLNKLDNMPFQIIPWIWGDVEDVLNQILNRCVECSAFSS